MPPSHADDGLQAALEVRRRVPGLPVSCSPQHLQRHYAVELLESGTQGVGYLLKQRIADIKRFADIRRIVAAAPCSTATWSPRCSTGRATTMARRADSPPAEVLELMAQGRSNAAIAEQLTISEKAVVAHVSRIYDVLGLANRHDDHRRVLAVVRYLSA